MRMYLEYAARNIDVLDEKGYT